MEKTDIPKTTKHCWENLDKYRDIHCSPVRRLHTANLSVLPKLIIIPIKIPAGCFVEIDKLILKCIWKYKEPRIAKAILKRQNQVWDLSLISRLTIVYKPTVIKIVQYWDKDRQLINGTKQNPELDTHKQLIFFFFF